MFEIILGNNKCLGLYENKGIHEANHVILVIKVILNLVVSSVRDKAIKNC